MLVLLHASAVAPFLLSHLHLPKQFSVAQNELSDVVSNLLLPFSNHFMHLHGHFITKRDERIPHKWHFVFHAFYDAVDEEIVYEDVPGVVTDVLHARVFQQLWVVESIPTCIVAVKEDFE